jgi:hypothetical protein
MKCLDKETDMNWEQFRRTDGSINLLDAFETIGDKYDYERKTASDEARSFIKNVESRRLIRSTQVAAVVLAVADIIEGEPR